MQVSNVQSETQRRTWVGKVSRWIVVLGLLALMPELMGLGGCPCGDDSDCPDGDFCDEGACVDCRDNADCSTELPVCVDTFCEECGEAADCDDGNACTTDTCDEINECVRDAVTCDDDDVCTTDSCDEATGCVFAEIDCDDGEICDSTTGECIADPCIGVVCDDSDDCTINSCDPATGDCVADPLCDDGDLCTTDSCSAGSCDFVTTVCDEGESCDPASGECGGDDGTAAQFDVLRLGNFFYPTGLFRCEGPVDVVGPPGNENCPLGFGCVGFHWHSDEVTAIASATEAANVSDSKINDPDTCFCGHGEVKDVTRTMISVSESELAAVLSANMLAELPAAGACPPSGDGEECMSNAQCDDGVDCTDDTCDTLTGACMNTDNCLGGLICLGGVDPTICD